MRKGERPLSVAEQLIVERLNALDYSTLKKLEDEMLHHWDHYQSELSKLEEGAEDSFFKGSGVKKEDIQKRIDYYFSAHLLSQKVANAYEERIFGPVPEIRFK